jgi:hypothetical protein
MLNAGQSRYIETSAGRDEYPVRRLDRSRVALIFGKKRHSAIALMLNVVVHE